MGTYTGSDKRLQYLFQNGGGGGSSTLAGLSDVNLSSPTDGQVLEYDATNQEWINANNSGGGGGDNIIGAFIDTSNIIVPSTSIAAGTQFSYTATEDCFFIIHFYLPSNFSVTFYIDGVAVQSYYLNVSASWQYIGNDQMFPLKKGQVISFTYPSSSPANANYSVFGVQGGSVFVGLADCYSTEERQVGCWTDGKPLYQKSINFGTLPNNTSKTVAHGITNVDNIFIVSGYVTTGSKQYNVEHTSEAFSYQWTSSVDATNVIIETFSDRTSLSAVLTIQYTKTTDTAGSGIWTPSGEYAEHYTNSEQVIGTYLGDTLYQKTISIASGTVTNRLLTITNDFSNVDKLVSWECNLYDQNEQRNYNLPYIRVTDTESLYLLVHRISDGTVGAVIFSRGNDYNNHVFKNIEFTLKYTKSA